MSTDNISQQKPDLGKLFAALSCLQATLEGAKADSVNPHYKSKYADLSSCWDACRVALQENGLCVVQIGIDSDPSVLKLRTILGHSSGQSISGVMTFKPQRPDPAGMGSALTYARRYGLCAILGISPEDDDAQQASQGPSPQQQQQYPQPPPQQQQQQYPQQQQQPAQGQQQQHSGPSEPMMKRMWAIAKSYGWDPRDQLDQLVGQTFGKAKNALTREEYDHLTNNLLPHQGDTIK